MRVRCYYNLHKHCLSVQYHGRVVDHVAGIALTECEFKVSEVGRQRVLRAHRRNVHAFVVGERVLEGLPASDYLEVAYNPYRCGFFTVRATGQPVRAAAAVEIHGRVIYATGLQYVSAKHAATRR